MGSYSREHQPARASPLLLLQAVGKSRNTEMGSKRRKMACFEPAETFLPAPLRAGAQASSSLVLVQLFLWGTVRADSSSPGTSDFLSALLNCFLLNHPC